MTDILKHADTYGEEIRELVEQVVHQELLQVAQEDDICPKCLALTLLEMAAYAATAAGASVGEMLEVAASGAVSAENEAEMADAEPPTQSRH